MKIAHFTWEYPPVIFGGLGTFALELTLKQKSFKNDISVFTINHQNQLEVYQKMNGIDVYRPKTVDFSSSFKLFADYELRAWGDNFSFFSDVAGYNLVSANFLVNELVKNQNKKFDLIDAHDWLGVLGGLVVKKELSIPLFFHIHSTEVGRSIGSGSHNIKEIEFQGGQRADCIITVSYAMKDELEKLGYPEDKIRVCWNGVDPDKYDPEKISVEEKKQIRKKYGILDNEIMLFFVGRLVTVKGVDHLIKAMPKILDEFPDVKLVILGVGGIENQLRELVEKHDLSKNVIFRTEFITETERIKHYAASDCVVLPSIYEPFGIVCTEAMSMAKPTVVGARGTNGFREQIIPEGEQQSGVHVNGSNPSDIAWGVKQILSDRKNADRIAENARKRVLKNFSWEKVAKRTLDIYKEFI